MIDGLAGALPFLNETAMPSRMNPIEMPNVASEMVSKTYGKENILAVSSMMDSCGGPMYGGTCPKRF